MAIDTDSSFVLSVGIGVHTSRSLCSCPLSMNCFSSSLFSTSANFSSGDANTSDGCGMRFSNTLASAGGLSTIAFVVFIESIFCNVSCDTSAMATTVSSSSSLSSSSIISISSSLLSIGTASCNVTNDGSVLFLVMLCVFHLDLDLDLASFSFLNSANNSLSSCCEFFLECECEDLADIRDNELADALTLCLGEDTRIIRLANDDKS
mmetsp:Transcript_15068/g.22784  ORF Transcript_15068/g.22784 Transcript_15068/m.22784 type:complete len:207 (-) Transcript_15068:243-863(-)